MIKHYLNFTKNGIYSGDMGVISCSLSSGMYEDNLGANRNIIETQNSNTDRRYFKRISLDPIEFELNLALEDGMDESQIDYICSWLINDYYEELYFEDEVDKIYYCLPTSQPKITHNGMNQGYITIQYRCFDGYLYSQEIPETFDLSANPVAGTTITLNNDGHVEVSPLVTITMNESNVTILNLTTNESTEFTNLLVGEIITLDNENEEITTNQTAINRYANHNDVFMRILPSSTQFKVTGKCTLTFTYRTKRKF
jgi:predicted phage tail component-like protein